MKHFKLFFALFAMLALGVGNAWAQDVIYTLDGTITGGSNGYADASTINQNNVSWSVVGNTTVSPWRIGGKSLTQIDRTIASTKAISSGVSKVVVNHGTISLTVNSLKLIVASDANFSNVISTISGTFTENSSTTFICPDDANWTNMYYKLVYNVTASGSSNKYFQFKSAVFYKAEPQAGDDIIVKTLKSIAVEGAKTDYEIGDIFKFEGTCTATYSVTKNDVAQEDETKVVTPTSVSTPDMSTAGTKEITVTYTEGDVTVTDKYEINVTENVVTPGTYTGNLNNVFFGCATGNNATEQSGKFDDVLVVAGCKSSASSKTNYQSDHVRFYADSYLTISVPDGYVIKSIVFTANGTWSGSITVSAGTYTDGTKTWTGNAQEVKFSFAAQNRIQSVKVTYAADVKYALNITTPSNGTLVVKDGSTVLADGAQVYEGTKLVVTPTPNAGYVFESLTVDGTPVDLTEGSYNLTMPAADVTISATFKLNEKPAATLTLSKNGETEDITGYKQDDKVTLPSITSDCVKEFVGWSADANCATEPEYKAGDEYTLASTTQTLYAVYATVEGGGEATASVNMATYATANSWGSTSSTNQKQITINSDVKAVISEGSNSGKYYNDGVRIYQSESATVTISTTVGELKSVKFTFTNNNDGTLLYGSTKLTSGTAIEVSGTSAVFTVSDTNDTENKGQIRFTAIEVVYTGGVSYSNYSTTCSAALTAPTFSVVEGEYVEAQSITLSAEEGTIYYTLDGTTPDAESIEYTDPIVLDECGTTTIKAIAISGENSSPVASATYTIKLPLNNSHANPYTEAEAIAVYNGGCYDNQEVYVKGVVANAQFYENSGSYTITLEGEFKFYKFYEAAGDSQFTENYIVAGDTLVACGKLVKFGETYELGEGCYLVERKPYSAPKVDISNTPETAYTVAEAMALIDNVTSDLTKQVYVKGEISEVESYNESYGSITYWIVDEDENKFQCYSGKGLNNEQFTSVEDLVVGSQVVVYGKMKKYGSTYEFDYNNYIVSLTLPSYTVTVTAENGTIEGLADDGKYEHGAVATITATAASGYKFVNWTKDKEVVSTEATYSFTVTADVALVANFAKDQGTALDNINTIVAPVKAIINGQLIIVKDGVKFNAQGQVVK